jgi:hypothetical protein
MTDPFTPITLSLATNVETIATARHEDTVPILMGEALRLIIAERLEQVTRHGNTIDHDQAHDQAELALAAKAYLDSYIDLALNPEIVRKPGDLPESWPWQGDFWKEPGPRDQAKALVKAIALAWAELDRIVIAQDLIDLFNAAADDFSDPDARCRVCGCTNERACTRDRVTGDPIAPCHWVEPDLCSACLSTQGETK